MSSTTDNDGIEKKKPRWIPLESNPQMLSQFARKIGASKDFGFSDCYGLDDDMLAWVPKPVLGFIFLFPSRAMKEAKKSNDDGDDVQHSNDSNVYFMEQRVGLACGSIATIHTLLNNADNVTFEKDSFIARFQADTKDMTPSQRGDYLGVAPGLEEISSEVAQGGQTEAPSVDDKIDYHFVAFVRVNDRVVELDGCKPAPIDHGATGADSFLSDVAKVVREQFIAKLPEGELGFSLMTFGNAPADD
jgi:ubiquitin carboxyl-terminal hydrolase L3